MSAVSYEVSATVREDLCKAFESFMTDVHIAEVMATGAFTSANFERLEPCRYRTIYIAPDRNSLAKYFTDNAPGLRADVAKRFPEGVEFSREEWEILASF